MATPPAKRKRADSTSIPQPDPLKIDYLPTILSLEAGTIANLLSDAAHKYSDVALTIIAEKRRFISVEREKAKNDALAQSAKVIDFDHYSKTAWRAINLQYKSMKGSYQYNASFGVQKDVVGCIKTIAKQCSAGASYGTKKSALETLRKIGKTVCMSGGDVIGHEVQIGFQADTSLEDTMYAIVENMTQQERDMVMKGDFGVKMEELVELAEGYCIFGRLNEVVALLEGMEGEPRDSDDLEDDDIGDSKDDSDE
ncbi:hypothetical protein MMC11_001659 [Xylographa trunciseda]|nr:hypothetical protein [Xylographa trunciseda]